MAWRASLASTGTGVLRRELCKLGGGMGSECVYSKLPLRGRWSGAVGGRESSFSRLAAVDGLDAVTVVIAVPGRLCALAGLISGMGIGMGSSG